MSPVAIRKIIVDFITTKYPDVRYKSGTQYYWSPEDKTVFYKARDTSQEGIWSLLHETGHALLHHTNYYSDFELVKMEVAAWEKAKELSEIISRNTENEKRKTGVLQKDNAASPVPIPYSLFTIPPPSEDHIQDCLDSYRDWLHKRSLCPDCRLSSIQINERTYACIFCHKQWHVTAERFCRPYRRNAV